MEEVKKILQEFWEDESINSIVKVALALLIANKLYEMGYQILKDNYF